MTLVTLRRLMFAQTLLILQAFIFVVEEFYNYYFLEFYCQVALRFYVGPLCGSLLRLTIEEFKIYFLCSHCVLDQRERKINYELFDFSTEKKLEP